MNEKFCVHEGMCVVFMQADWPVISCQADRYRLFGKKHYIQTLSFSMNSKLSANKFNNVLFMYIYCQIRLFSIGGWGGGYLLDTINHFKSVKVLMDK